MVQSRYHFEDTLNPVLALAIHNGHDLPEALLPYSGVDEDIRFREEDPYTDSFAALFPNHIVVETSRFAVDLNRPIQRAIYQKPEDAWGLTVRSKPMNEDILQALQQGYQQWYDVLKYEVDRMLSFHPFIVVLDLHSFNHRRGGAQAEPDPQIENPDIILGRNNMPEEYYPYIEQLRLKLDGLDLLEHKLDVRCDVKFPGGQLSRWLHQNYPGQLICIAVEFKKIFMDEWSGTLNPSMFSLLRSSFQTAINSWLTELPKLVS